jgi:hypothetical protein
VVEVQEHLRALSREALPLAGEAQVAAQLRAHPDLTARRREVEHGQLLAGLEHPALVHGEVHLPVDVALAAGGEAHSRVAPPAPLAAHRADPEVDAQPDGLARQLVEPGLDLAGVEPPQERQVVGVAGQRALRQRDEGAGLGPREGLPDPVEVVGDGVPDRELRQEDG